MRLTQYIVIMAVIMMISPFPSYSMENSERLDNTIFDTPQRPCAVFDHDDHNEKAGLDEDCSICHHVHDGKQKIEGESSEDYSCSDCHSLKPSDENAVPLRMAFHKQCRTCHVRSKKGPILCGQCHTRK